MDYLNQRLDKDKKLVVGKPARRETATLEYPERAVSVDREAKEKTLKKRERRG